MSDNTGGDLTMRNDQGHLQEEQGPSESGSAGKSQGILGSEPVRQMWKHVQLGTTSGDGKTKNGAQLLTLAHGTSVHSPQNIGSNNQPINLRADKRICPDTDCHVSDHLKHVKYVQKADHSGADATMNSDAGSRPGQTPNRGMLSQAGHVQHAAIHRFVQEKLNTMSLDTINSYLRRHRVQHTRRQKSALLAELLADESEDPSGHASASQTPTGRGQRINPNQQVPYSHVKTSKFENGLIYDPKVDSDIEGESWTRNILSPITGKMNILSYSWNVIKSEDGTDEYIMESATRVRPKAGPESNNVHFPRPNVNSGNNPVEVDRTQTLDEKANIVNVAPSTSYNAPVDNVDNNKARTGAAALAQSFKQHLHRATDQNHLYQTVFVDLTQDEEENQRQPRQETARVLNPQRGGSVVQGPNSRPILTIRQGPVASGYQTQMDYPPPPPGYWQSAPPQLVPPPPFAPPHMFNFSVAPPGPPGIFPPQLAPPPLGGLPPFYPAQHVPNFPPDPSQQMQGFGAP
ncbi:uncharacterized protein LOC106663361 [Cimex lectularius]|uniref:Uncharacterized protein n=1 Tax=Cimex lectularius TaxID=79782 RepID=A0A8I6TCE5_CIMLE|nr:uncharacterized protein LOC106663361 [Cimex lectularius]